MTVDLSAPVAASNALTRRWIAELDTTTDCLVSGFSAWHLLSILAIGATGRAREELATATDIDTAGGSDGVNELFGALAGDLASGVGLWVRPDVVLDPSFVDELQGMTVDVIPDDPAVLDQWVSESTGGILEKFPISVNDGTRLVAASALGLDTPWRRPFTPGGTQWSDGSDDWFEGLTRSQSSRVNGAVISGSEACVSRYVCETEDNIDVHLVGGAASDSGTDVLITAIEALQGIAEVEPLDAMPSGTTLGCMSIVTVPGYEDSLVVRLPAFQLDTAHDMTEQADLFGLRTGLDASSGHFGRIAAEPLALDQVRQVAMAAFSALGFRAAAATSAAMMAGAGPPAGDCTIVRFDFDRPFGMLAVHRPTNLILFAGWIATSAALVRDEWRNTHKTL